MIKQQENPLVNAQYERLAILGRRILRLGFGLSIIAYIVLFILPTAFGMQVVTAPRQEDSQKKSLYYLKHIQPTDLKVGDTVIYIDEVGSTQITKVTQKLEGDTVPTKAGHIQYGNTVGIPWQQIGVLGSFHEKNLTPGGRLAMVVYVVIVLLLNYLLSYFIPREVSDEEMAVATPVVESDKKTSLEVEPDEKTSLEMELLAVLKLARELESGVSPVLLPAPDPVIAIESLQVDEPIKQSTTPHLPKSKVRTDDEKEKAALSLKKNSFFNRKKGRHDIGKHSVNKW